MNARERVIKNLLFLSAMVYYLGGYFLINLYSGTRVRVFHLDFPQESSIPFYPAFIFGYMGLYAVISMTYILIQDLDYFKKAIKAFYIVVSVHFLFFLLFPVEFNLRPTIDPTDGVIFQIVHFFYWIDLPYNCFPSLHISNAFLVAFLLQRYRPGLGRIFFPIASLIAVSVILVKQHFVADVFGGFLVAWAVNRWMWREEISPMLASYEPIAREPVEPSSGL